MPDITAHNVFKKSAAILGELALLGMVIILPLTFFWWVGMNNFVITIQSQHPHEPSRKTDAIVVLTGGAGRLQAGLDLLSNGMAEQLLISGVSKGVALKQLLDLWDNGHATSARDLSCCITLGYAAGNTQGNATETTKWLTKHGFKSIRLVTANYHMPRASMIFHHYMPHITIIEHPVTPQTTQNNAWWETSKGRKLVIHEYNKYFLTGLGLALSDERHHETGDSTP